MNRWSVYIILNIVNGTKYVGVTRKEPAIKRFNQHMRDSRLGKSNMLVHRAIRKHGESSFSFEIHSIYFDSDSAFEAEKNLIKECRERGEKLYNIHPGGQGERNTTEERKEKSRQRSSGKHMSLETRRKISSSNKGRRLTPEQKERHMRSLNTPEYKEKLSKFLRSRKLSCDHKKSIRLGMIRAHQEDPHMREKCKKVGEKNGMAKLTERDVVLMREEWERSNFKSRSTDRCDFFKRYSKKFDTTIMAIYNVIRHKSWKHIL